MKKTFNTGSWWDHHETWKDMRYDWLPSWGEIPKHLHEKTSRSHLRSLNVSSMHVRITDLCLWCECVNESLFVSLSLVTPPKGKKE